MKTRMTCAVKAYIHDWLRENTPPYDKSKVLEALMLKYLYDGELDTSDREYFKGSMSYYHCSFTIDVDVWESFRREVKTNRDSTINFILRQFMESESNG